MTGNLPIIDRDGRTVAVLSWNGTMWRGDGKWVRVTDQAKKQIDAAVSENADLGLENFSDMVGDASWVRGWQGFAGWFQALSIALPAYGLRVDPDHIQWPFEPANEQQQPPAS